MKDFGVGIGFRKEIAEELLNLPPDKKPDFVEFAPENWMDIGGYWKEVLGLIAQKYPITTHGLSLSIGSPGELDLPFLKKLKSFFDETPVVLYSEHLSYSKCDNAHLFDLMPIPFRKDAVRHIVDRIQQVQDVLQRPIALENVSYYTPVDPEMDEASFISEIVNQSGCGLLLDVNNVYVNSFNHNYDAKTFLSNLPLDKVMYMHMAGHLQVDETTIIDTHGMPIIEPVFDLFDWVLPKLNPVPVLLERDFNLPPMEELMAEHTRLKDICNKHWIHEGVE
ncbi:MAG: hypothetical protein ACJAY8_000098 [Sphingobacteriales bacterium]|jgi:uncharacterized protein (UPF0276 family)